MVGYIAIGILLVLSGVGAAYFLKRFSFVRNDPLIYYTTLANPGLVGIFAGAAFFFKPFLPDMTEILLFCAIGLIILTLPIIIFILPKAWTAQVLEQAKKETENESSPIDEEK